MIEQKIESNRINVIQNHERRLRFEWKLVKKENEKQ